MRDAPTEPRPLDIDTPDGRPTLPPDPSEPAVDEPSMKLPGAEEPDLLPNVEVPEAQM